MSQPILFIVLLFMNNLPRPFSLSTLSHLSMLSRTLDAPRSFHHLLPHSFVYEFLQLSPSRFSLIVTFPTVAIDGQLKANSSSCCEHATLSRFHLCVQDVPPLSSESSEECIHVLQSPFSQMLYLDCTFSSIQPEYRHLIDEIEGHHVKDTWIRNSQQTFTFTTES